MLMNLKERENENWNKKLNCNVYATRGRSIGPENVFKSVFAG